MRPVLFVLAGVNGAGKSSLGGAILRRRGMNYFNPDEAAARIREELGCSVGEANALAELRSTPEWAQPIIERAIQLSSGR